jgi:hypothetical protein
MEYTELLRRVFEVARQQVEKGPGWAQQRAVLEEVANQIPGARMDDHIQQRILTCWHDLFRLGRLSWGFNIDNPDAPFYHIPEPEARRDEVRQ